MSKRSLRAPVPGAGMAATLRSPEPWRAGLPSLLVRALPECRRLDGVTREYEVENGLLKEILEDPA
ncbi:MAG TPA: hypothetical protein VLV15_03460 [Dongiaceae bacterium]|nr:hypothetical protein [Dongiaceae bacterium]